MYPTSRDFTLWHIYLLYFCLGVFGGHHFALRRFRTAFLYLFTFGFFGLGTLLDFFLIPYYHRMYQTQRESSHLTTDQSQPTDATPSSDLAFAHTQSTTTCYSWKVIPWPLRPFYWGYVWILLCLTPIFYLSFFGDFGFLFLFVLLMITILFPSGLYKFAKVPILGHFILGFLNGLTDLQNFYKSHQAYSIFTKTFLGPLGFLFPAIRQEITLFKGLIQFSVIYVMYEWVFLLVEYFEYYHPYPSAIKMLFSVKIPVLLVQFIFLSWFVLPLTHGLMRLKDHTHNKFKISFLFTAFVMFFIFFHVHSSKDLVYEDFERLRTRLKAQTSFFDQVRQSSIVALQQSTAHTLSMLAVEKPISSLAPSHTSSSTTTPPTTPRSTTPRSTQNLFNMLQSLGIYIHPVLSQKLYHTIYDHLKLLVPSTSPEMNALHVLVFQRKTLSSIHVQKALIKENTSYTHQAWLRSRDNAVFLPKQAGLFALVYFGFSRKDIESLAVFEWKNHTWHFITNHNPIIYREEIYLINKFLLKMSKED